MATTEAAPATRSSKGSRTGLVTVAILATLITLVAVGTYSSASLDELASDPDNTIAQVYAGVSPLVQAAFYLHVASGAVALLLGPFQFSRWLRNRFTRAHRVTGRVYIVAVWLGAIGGLVIAPFNSAGVIGILGFGLLGIFWFLSGSLAYRHARARRLDEHRAWMIRNYSLTFAGVTLRAWLPILIGAYTAATGADVARGFEWAYAIVPFLCWVPNILVAEWLVRRRGLPMIGARGA